MKPLTDTEISHALSNNRDVMEGPLARQFASNLRYARELLSTHVLNLHYVACELPADFNHRGSFNACPNLACAEVRAFLGLESE